MPFYVYEVIRKDAKPGRRFEVMQNMSDPPLKRDPKTGQPVRRVFLPPNTPGFKYDGAIKKLSKRDRKFTPPSESVHKPITPTST